MQQVCRVRNKSWYLC